MSQQFFRQISLPNMFYIWCKCHILHANYDLERYINSNIKTVFPVTSMLVTDVGNEMCWWQLQNFVDGFCHFGHQHPLFTFAFGTNLQQMSPTSKHCHQHHCKRISLSFGVAKLDWQTNDDSKAGGPRK